MMKLSGLFLAAFAMLFGTLPASGDATPIALIHTPVPNPIMTSGYGMRTHPITGQRQFHSAIDLRAKLNQPVESVFAGVVEKAGQRGLLGNAVEIFHPEQNITTIYGHLNRVTVKAGDRLSMGSQIGLAGSTGRSTGVHVHLIVKKGLDGKALNPLAVLNDKRYPHVTAGAATELLLNQSKKPATESLINPAVNSLLQAFVGMPV